ncbi:low molecular weight phosphatase family protein [Mycobacterium sp. ITM-2016-00317]|uniref:arsenate reductase/protein-tyrosine-phosphatase family protein n=1 Tax=Mycobacterium sp. ITM-2016-00317 TaxID=2099694 RepID=UPI000D4456FD|nr:low molecular weight phosphatase family protein [Mycobacterium sp. ITM-2016-00317]WNG88966.1 low molecular weight phosphatase family protein [Mycobacterium sp. ITM-2016-00317]
MHVLFVCTGNICRSPTAERLARAGAVQMQIPDFTASSAGTRAVIGHPIHQEAASVVEQLGGVAVDFAARQLSGRLASSADLILTMTRAHRDSVLELAPQKLNRTFTLPEVAALSSGSGATSIADLAALRSGLEIDADLDIEDPIGQSAEVFAAVGARIARLLPPVLELCRRSIDPDAM